MLTSNLKFMMAFLLYCGFLKTACASTIEEHRSYARSAAASSIRSTVSRKEENINKLVIYGKPDKLYHPISEALFKRENFFSDWDALSDLVTPNEQNKWSPQYPERVRNVIVDTGMFCIMRDFKAANPEKAYLHVVNLMRFLSRDTFAKSEFHSWQASFMKVVDEHQASVFLNLITIQPDQALLHNSFKIFSELFFGENGILQQYNKVRLSDDNGARGNNFAHFESLFGSVIDRYLLEKKQQADAARDAQLLALTEQVRRMEELQKSQSQQQAENMRLEAAQRRQSNQSQQRSGTGCVMQ